ncbi:MAG: hypothetical protein K2H49_06100, partial [Muribaculaceae bacterium]|nr:hypothetical protein [Muribaculaceae bacterium]
MRHLTFTLLAGITSISFAQITETMPLPPGTEEMDASADRAMTMLDENIAMADSMATDSIVFEPVVIRDLQEILLSLPDTMPELPYNPIVGPWVFSGYRPIKQRSFKDLTNRPDTGIEQYTTPKWEQHPYCPKWLHDALTQARISQDYMYYTMVNTPHTIQY